MRICGFSPVNFQPVETGRGLIGFLFSLTQTITIHTFFLLRACLQPNMDTVLFSFEVAAKEATVAVPFQLFAACLTGYAVVVALSSEMLTRAHVKR